MVRILESRKIIKAGHKVGGDITRLLKTRHPPGREPGSRDEIVRASVAELVRTCRERLVPLPAQHSSRMTLGTILETLTGYTLSKAAALRQHSKWQETELEHAHALYAARDAKASRIAHIRACEWAVVSSKHSSKTPVAISDGVSLVDATGRPIADGAVASIPGNHAGRVLTGAALPSMLDINIVSVRHHGARVQGPNGTIHSLQGLQTPVTLQVARSAVYDRAPASPILDYERLGLPPLRPVEIHAAAQRQAVIVTDECPSEEVATLEEEEQQEARQADQRRAMGAAGDNDGNEDNLIENEALLEMETVHAAHRQARREPINTASLRTAIAAETPHAPLLPPSDDLPLGAAVVRTRILQDVFHALARPQVPKNHAAYWFYINETIDAATVDDKDDRSRVDAYLRGRGINDIERFRRFNRDWFNRRVRRTFLRCELMAPALAQVYSFAQNLVDKKTGLKFFDVKARDAAQRVVDLASQGYLSDPPGVALYKETGVDANGLSLYRCSRGTNNVESFFTQIFRRYGSLHSGMELTFAALLQLRLVNNVHVSLTFALPWEDTSQHSTD